MDEGNFIWVLSKELERSCAPQQENKFYSTLLAKQVKLV